MFKKLEKDRLWIAFGKVKDRTWIPIHGVSISLGLRALGVIFDMRLLVATECWSFVEKVSEQHDRHGKYLTMRQIGLVIRAKRLLSLVTRTWNLLKPF